MKTAIVLCLLVTIYGLSIVASEDKDKITDQTEFDVVKTHADMKSKMQKLMITNIEEVIKMHISTTLASVRTREIFQARLMTALNNTHAAMDAAKSEGKDARYCFNNSVGKLTKLEEDFELQFSSCANASLEEFTDNLSIFGNLLKEGDAMILEMSVTFVQCHNQMFDSSRCLINAIKKSKAYVELFDEKCEWYPMYRAIVFQKVYGNSLQCLHNRFIEGTKKVEESEVIDQSCIEGAE